MTKKCASCKGIKSVEEFYPFRNSDDGYQPYCKACHKAKTQRDYYYDKEDIIYKVLCWQIDNPEKVREYKRKYKAYEKEQRKIRNNGNVRVGRPPKAKSQGEQSENQN